MSTFHAFVSTCLIIIVAFALAACLMLRNYLTTIRNQLWKIYDGGQAFIRDANDVWSTILRIRDDTSKITGLLDKDEEEPEEDADISEDSWSTAPCPVCGGPAYMDYSLPAGDGYCVMCGKNANEHGHCDYGLVAGGKTRRTAAFEWNKAALVYCNKKMQLVLDDDEKEGKDES